MTTFFVKKLYAGAPDIDAMLEANGDLSVVNSGCVVLLLNGSPIRNSVHILKGEINVSCPNGSAASHEIKRGDWGVIPKAEGVKIAKAWNTSIAISRRNASFVGKINALLRHDGPYEVHYRLNFVDER